jgi:hypothetical protein
MNLRRTSSGVAAGGLRSSTPPSKNAFDYEVVPVVTGEASISPTVHRNTSVRLSVTNETDCST